MLEPLYDYLLKNTDETYFISYTKNRNQDEIVLIENGTKDLSAELASKNKQTLCFIHTQEKEVHYSDFISFGELINNALEYLKTITV